MSAILLGFSVTHRDQIELRWTILPIQNGEEVFRPCSRSAPKYRKVIQLADSIYSNAILYLIDKEDRIKEKVGVSLEGYTIQLVGYKYRRKKYIYINASITKLAKEAKLNWKEHAIIWCDDNTSSWGAVYDIDNNTIVDFRTNGPNVISLKKI